MPRVHLLPDSLVDQIAAGEVVERPASVAKELVENALDAGARRIWVEVDGGGVARLSVLDDGCGMEPEDARLSLERHATSKIRTEGDLARIAALGTLGFRGEALPSIASVSRLVLTTSPDDSGLGTEVVADRGAPPELRPARHPRGTRVLVEDLFGNVPARRKFLKGPEAELRAVTRTVTALALVRPDVAFGLSSGRNARLLDLPPAAGAGERLAEVLGRSAGGEAPIPLRASAPGLALTGALLPPSVSFPSRAYQWIFVNGRAVKDATVAHAVALASREALSDRHPALALFLELDASLCDVNVHPQKREVRFRDADAVHHLVHRALLAALTGAKSVAALPVSRLAALPEAMGQPLRGFPRPLPEGGSWPSSPSPAATVLAEAVGAWGAAPAGPALITAPAVEFARGAYSGLRAPGGAGASTLGQLRLLGQYRDAFLLAEGGDGLVLVDQHAAHERVRYEEIRARLAAAVAAGAAGSPPAQRLLLPVTYEASPAEAAQLSRALPLLAEAGFAASELSGRTLSITAAPADCPVAAVAPFLRDLLASLASGPDGGSGAGARDALAASLACRGAITLGTPLAPAAALRLLADLARCADPYSCPHGRPTLLSLSHTDLLRRFGRSA